MCGIAGVVGLSASRPLVEGMNDCLAHRGRDDSATAELHDIDGRSVGAFGHRRLSILDLSSAGHQPMASEDGRFLIVFNGEIYNFRALRDGLRSRGHSFRSDSDTEVLIAGWREHGVEFLRTLRGMFAFALWDRARGELILARDPFGIKPLYVSRRGSTIAFASEIRALVNAGFATRTISKQAVRAYLSLGSIPEPLAALEGVGPLSPGTILRCKLERGVVHSQSNTAFAAPLEPSGEPPVRDMKSAARIVREALADSVAHHLVSDVPVGLFLSGGVDSSAVVALATQASGATLDTFTVVFDDARFNEAGPARAVATQYRTRHREITLSDADLLAALPNAFAAMDQPSLDGLNTYAVSRAVHDAGLKVVLSGLGGDELFGGYASFRRAWLARRLWRGTSWARAPLTALAEHVGDGRADKLALFLGAPDVALGVYEASRALFAGRGLEALVGGGELPAVAPPPDGLSVLQRVSWYELTGYMRSVLLRDSDVFSMASHLELRVPFVDRGVAAASLRVDDSLKMQGGGKAVLVEAVRDLLPREVWDRPKQGFALPFNGWMRGVLKADVGSALCSEQRVARVGISPSAARRVWQRFLADQGVTWSRPWAIYTLVRWAEECGAELTDEVVARDLGTHALAS